MEATNYKSIGPVLQLNKAGELTQKRMKAVKACDGLYISEPDKNGYMKFICELNDVIWLDCKAAETKIAYGIKRIPSYFKDIKAGCFDGKNIEKFRREISRRINRPDSPVIMELKKPERKKPAPLAENERKVSVLMLKGRTDEITEKRVVIAEVVPHVYTYTYKLKNYGERVKIIFEIDGVYFQGHDTGAYVLEREDFIEVCTKAYELARQNVADGAANGMAYFIEVQKRIDAATPTETPQISTEIAEVTNVSTEGGNAENEPQKHISEVLKEAERNYQCVKSETLRTVREADGKWHTYFMDDEIGTDLDYDQINHIPASRTAQAAEEVAEIRRYLNRLNGNHIADADYYLAEMREGIRQAEASRHKKNAEAEGEKAAERAENNESAKLLTVIKRHEWGATPILFAYDPDKHIASATFKSISGDISVVNAKCDNDGYCHVYDSCITIEELAWENMHTHNFIEPPQSPEAPQIVECIADTPKPRETARKPQNRGIGSAQHHQCSALGANGYTMLDNASATLTAMSVPRECSTADAAHW